MKAIKLIVVTIIQFYASIIGIDSEEKKANKELHCIIHYDSMPDSKVFYLQKSETQMDESQLWYVWGYKVVE